MTAANLCSLGVPLQFIFLSCEIAEVIGHTVPNFAIINLLFLGVRITCLLKVKKKTEAVSSVSLSQGQVHPRLKN